MNRPTIFRRPLLCIGFLGLMAAAVFAQEGLRYVPLASYELVSLDSQTIDSIAVGLAVVGDDLASAGTYRRHEFRDPLGFDYPRVYHSIDLLVSGKVSRHHYAAALKSESDQPVYGGLGTFQAAAVYGYELLRRDGLSLVLGGGLAATDFGIELPDGRDWPLLPVPFVRFAYQSDLLDAGFDFVTGPHLSLTLAPRSRIRLAGDLRMDQFRDARDLIFESALEYRLFASQHPMGDFAGISVGVKGDEYQFALGDKDESLEVHYYALFGRIDLALLKITAGYAFEARERYREEHAFDMGDGLFVSVQGMYRF